METLNELHDYLSQIQFDSLLELTPTSPTWVQEYCLSRGIDYHCCNTLPAQHQRRYDLCIINLSSEFPTDAPAIVVGTIKNLFSDRIWILTDSNDECFEKHYLSLGLIRAKTSNRSQFLSYSYNLETYNRKRDWNNTRFWANPQHWLKRF